jgi:hypothetical protein
LIQRLLQWNVFAGTQRVFERIDASPWALQDKIHDVFYVTAAGELRGDKTEKLT